MKFFDNNNVRVSKPKYQTQDAEIKKFHKTETMD